MMTQVAQWYRFIDEVAEDVYNNPAIDWVEPQRFRIQYADWRGFYGTGAPFPILNEEDQSNPEEVT